MVILVLTHNGAQSVHIDGDACMILVDGQVVHSQGDLSKSPEPTAGNTARSVYANSVQQSTVITGNGNAVAQGGSVASVNFGKGVNLSGANIASGIIAGGNIVQSNVVIDGNGNRVVSVNGSIGVNGGNIFYNGGDWDKD